MTFNFPRIKTKQLMSNILIPLEKSPAEGQKGARLFIPLKCVVVRGSKNLACLEPRQDCVTGLSYILQRGKD
jgi:hypothetical protein